MLNYDHENLFSYRFLIVIERTSHHQTYSLKFLLCVYYFNFYFFTMISIQVEMTSVIVSSLITSKNNLLKSI